MSRPGVVAALSLALAALVGCGERAEPVAASAPVALLPPPVIRYNAPTPTPTPTSPPDRQALIRQCFADLNRTAVEGASLESRWTQGCALATGNDPSARDVVLARESAFLNAAGYPSADWTTIRIGWAHCAMLMNTPVRGYWIDQYAKDIFGSAAATEAHLALVRNYPTLCPEADEPMPGNLQPWDKNKYESYCKPEAAVHAKAPATIEQGFYWSRTEDEDRVLVVNGSFDAQNRFGVPLRHRIRCVWLATYTGYPIKALVEVSEG